MNQLKSNQYNPVEVKIPGVLGKRKHEDDSKKKTVARSIKKRDQKEESKDVVAGTKRSARLARNQNPIYDEKVIDQLVLGGSKNKSRENGAINVMLAQTYDPDRDDPTGWLMSEKLDGVRCYWDGSTLYTRNGN